jgi:Cu-Zn family superoxide dismutase
MSQKNLARLSLFVCIFAIFAGISSLSAQSATETAMGATASTTVMDKADKAMGTVTFTTLEDGHVLVEADVTGLTPGFHGFHIHGMGMCDHTTESPFTSAGGHLVIGAEKLTHPNHNGDMPSLLALQDGSAKLSFETDRFAISDLFDADGSAVIIHANAENYGNIPERYGTPDDATLNTGDAGGRVGCGIIKEMSM